MYFRPDCILRDRNVNLCSRRLRNTDWQLALPVWGRALRRLGAGRLGQGLPAAWRRGRGPVSPSPAFARAARPREVQHAAACSEGKHDRVREQLAGVVWVFTFLFQLPQHPIGRIESQTPVDIWP